MEAVSTSALIRFLANSFVVKELSSDGKSYIKSTLRAKRNAAALQRDFQAQLNRILENELIRNESVGREEELDFQGLYDFFQVVFPDKMKQYLTANGKERKEIYKDILSQSKKEAKCKTDRANERAEGITNEIVTATDLFFRKQLPQDLLIATGEIELTFQNSMDPIKVAIERIHELLSGILAFLIQSEDYLYNYLHDLFQSTRKEHPSFKLMQPGAFDKRLSPTIKTVTSKDGAINFQAGSSVWHFIADTWQEAENYSIVITGEGGIGKSVALLSMPDQIFESHHIPVLYIPMTDLVEKDDACLTITNYLRNRIHEKADAICTLAAQPWNGPSLLLLLDGFNEVPMHLRQDMLALLKQWHTDHPSAQLIAISRPINGYSLADQLPGRSMHIELATLKRDAVREYVREHFPTRSLPSSKSKLWELLVYPLFLTLYLRADTLNKSAACGYPLEPKETIGQGTILWNYCQRELLRKQSEPWVIRYSVISEYLLPRIAWEMVLRGQMAFSRREIIELLEQAINLMDISQLPRHLRQIWNLYEDRNGIFPDLHALLSRKHINSIVFNECGILTATSSTRTHFAFIHQHFRDYFAGVHLVSLAEVEEKNEIPEAWHNKQSLLVMDYTAELISELTAIKLWESNRLSQQFSRGCKTNHLMTCYLLELWKHRSIPKMGINFSGMDLRGLSLARYLADSDMMLFRNPSNSYRTKLSISNFFSEGHFSAINCIAILQDEYIVSNSIDGLILIWEPTTGHCLRTIFQAEIMNCFGGSYAGLIIGCDKHGIIREWDGFSGKLVREWRAHNQPINCITVLSNGNCVSGSDDSTIRVWDSKTGERLAFVGRHDAPVNCVTSLPDGSIASASADGLIRIWNLESGVDPKVLEGHKAPVNCIAVLPDGSLVSGSDDGTMRLWGGKEYDCLKTCEIGECINSIAVLPDGRVIGSNASSCTVWLWNYYENSSINVLHDIRASSIVAFLDGRIIGYLYDSIMIWDSATWTCYHNLGLHLEPVHCLSVLADGHVVSGSGDGKLRVWDPMTGKLQLTMLGNTTKISGLATTPDGHVVSGSEDNKLCEWDPVGGSPLHDVQAASYPASITCIDAFPDGRIICGFWGSSLFAWDPSKGTIQLLKGSNRFVNCISVLSNEFVAYGTITGQIQVWNCKAEKLVYSQYGRGAVSCIAAIKRAKIVVGYRSGELEIADLDKEKWFPFSSKHASAVSCVAVLRDGKVVSGSKDRTVRVWDTTTGRCLRIIEREAAEIECISVLTDGNVIIGLSNGGLEVWDIDEGDRISYFVPLEYDVSKMNFSKAILNEDEAMLLWQNGATVR